MQGKPTLGFRLTQKRIARGELTPELKAEFDEADRKIAELKAELDHYETVASRRQAIIDTIKLFEEQAASPEDYMKELRDAAAQLAFENQGPAVDVQTSTPEKKKPGRPAGSKGIPSGVKQAA